MNKPNFAFDLPAKERGWLLNLFNLAVRDGRRTTTLVLLNVRQRVAKYLKDPYVSLERVALLKAFDKQLNSFEAIQYAQYTIEYEALPLEQRQQIKSVRAEEQKQLYFGAQPATEKQIAYLRKLGWKGEINSKQHASELINQLLKKTA